MVFEKVQEIIAEHLGLDVDEVAFESNIKNDLDADSLDEVEIVMELEDAFDIEIPDEDASRFVTVEDIVKYVEGLI